jgi:hypothetical protein
MDVYQELAIDLVKTCSINMFTAKKIVAALEDLGLLDYDTLKEVYLEQEE